MTDAHGGPFTPSDLDTLTSAAVAAWRAGRDRDWSVPAGTLEWSCTRTADHCVDAVLAVALFLASGRRDSYPEWGWGEQLMGPAATPERLAEALGAVGMVLAGTVTVADPGTRSIIWQGSARGTGTPPDFAARGGFEMALHVHDVCAGLGVPFAPPAGVAERLREHTRGWPHWSAPGWTEAGGGDDAWGDLLRAAGRRPLPS
ncbi:MAG TPA: hypothetical protein VIL36_23990 [Acidimicrobiales bacterium]